MVRPSTVASHRVDHRKKAGLPVNASTPFQANTTVMHATKSFILLPNAVRNSALCCTEAINKGDGSVLEDNLTMNAIREADPAVAALAVFGALILLNMAGKVRKRPAFLVWKWTTPLSCP
jgi:hypothetical protein